MKSMMRLPEHANHLGAAFRNRSLPEESVDIVRAQRSVSAGIRYLIASQDEDGMWRDYALDVGVSTSWVTSFVLLGLESVRSHLFNPELRRSIFAACDALRRVIRRSGGWGYNESVADDCDTTAHVVLALRQAQAAVPPSAIERIRQFEVTPGLFRTFLEKPTDHSWGLPHLEVSAVATLALGEAHRIHGFWCAVSTELEQASHWDSFWWASPAYVTYAVAWALAPHAAHYHIRALLQRHVAACLSDSCLLSLALTGMAACYVGALEVADKTAIRLVRLQREDGGWAGSNYVRYTDADCTENWIANRHAAGPIVSDSRGLFTTAAVVRFLSEYSDHRIQLLQTGSR